MWRWRRSGCKSDRVSGTKSSQHTWAWYIKCMELYISLSYSWNFKSLWAFFLRLLNMRISFIFALSYEWDKNIAHMDHTRGFQLQLWISVWTKLCYFCCYHSRYMNFWLALYSTLLIFLVLQIKRERLRYDDKIWWEIAAIGI